MNKSDHSLYTDQHHRSPNCYSPGYSEKRSTTERNVESDGVADWDGVVCGCVCVCWGWED